MNEEVTVLQTLRGSGNLQTASQIVEPTRVVRQLHFHLSQLQMTMTTSTDK